MIQPWPFSDSVILAATSFLAWFTHCERPLLHHASGDADQLLLWPAGSREQQAGCKLGELVCGEQPAQTVKLTLRES